MEPTIKELKIKIYIFIKKKKKKKKKDYICIYINKLYYKLIKFITNKKNNNNLNK